MKYRSPEYWRSAAMMAFCMAILAASFSIAGAQTQRVIIIKVDGLPYEQVERFTRERDPETGKSRLPWFDHIYFENGTRLTNFYVRGTSLSAPSWSTIDTGQHLQIKGNAEFDRNALYTYDYLGAAQLYRGQLNHTEVDMPGMAVLDELGIPPLIDAYDNYQRLPGLQIYQRGARMRTFQHAGEEAFLKHPVELATEFAFGFDLHRVVFDQLERELLARLDDANVRYMDLWIGWFDHTAHHNNDPDSHLQALREIDALLGRIWTAIEKSPLASETALVLVSDHGFNTDERVISQGFNLVKLLGSSAGGGHHVATKRRLLMNYSLKGVYPFTPLITTAATQSFYLAGQSSDYPTAALDFDGNERAGLHLRNSGFNLLHLMLTELQRRDLSAPLRSALTNAFFTTLESNRGKWQSGLDQLDEELRALRSEIEAQQKIVKALPKKFSKEESALGKDDDARRAQVRVLESTEFEERYRVRYLEPMRRLLSLRRENFDPFGLKIEAVIPKGAMGPRNSIHDLQNYVVGPGTAGSVMRGDGTLDMERSFQRLDNLRMLHEQTVRNNVQAAVANHPIDFIATRIPREQIAPALDDEFKPDDDAVWIYGGPDSQALILPRGERSGQLSLRYLPVANLAQAADGSIHFDRAEWKPGLPLEMLEDTWLEVPAGDRVAWLSAWHTDLEWLRALHKTHYSNGLIGLHEHFGVFPAPGTDAGAPGLSQHELLVRRFRKRQRQAVETDMLILANDHWNFDVRGFNPGGNHGSFFRISTHSTLMFAGGERTGIPRGLAVNEPYDSLSVTPTILALGGEIESDNRPVEALARRGFQKFPGRVIPEVAGRSFKSSKSSGAQ